MKYWDYVTERLYDGKVEWPNGARLAVLVMFDYQAEVGEADYVFPDGTPHYGQITEASYGGRVGIWRLLDILDRHKIRATFNTCGMTAERYPESARAIVERGHEIAGHTYSHKQAWKLSYDEEVEDIRKTVATIKNITGAQIRGWRDPIVQPSPNTFKILADQGFTWDGNFLNGDLPYMLDVGGKSLVEIPYTFSTDDFPFIYGNTNVASGGFPAPKNTMADLYQMWMDEFTVLYEESATSPKMFAWQNHPLVMGRAHRALYFDRFLTHLKKHQDVWFASCGDVADWWLKNYNSRSHSEQFGDQFQKAA